MTAVKKWVYSRVYNWVFRNLNLKKIIFLLALPIIFFLACNTISLHAQTTTDIQTKIDDKNTQILQLQKEIDQYNAQVTQVAGQAKTLQNALKTLDLTAQKLQANLTLTEDKITQANLTIQKLSSTIGTTQTHIGLNQKSLAETIRTMNETEGQTPLENFFVYKHLSDFWDEVITLGQFERTVQIQSRDLISTTQDLGDKKTSQESEKQQLSKLEQDLSDQQKVVQENSQAKAALLTQTKNQEANYRQILSSKQAEVNQYEKDLFDYESQLQLITSTSQIPTPRHGTISWPVDNVRITQLFGVTNASARLYVSGSHNGVDFAASIGTPVKAALNGVVVGTGNTDVFPGCYSFGRWVMIKHPNGLSTIYAHLSVIKSAVGDNVSTGDIIGLSGYSGYVYPPGPAGAHVHLGVYATAGVEIKQFTQSIGCKQAIVPIADVKAYLDPMLYLPLQ